MLSSIALFSRKKNKRNTYCRFFFLRHTHTLTHSHTHTLTHSHTHTHTIPRARIACCEVFGFPCALQKASFVSRLFSTSKNKKEEKGKKKKEKKMAMPTKTELALFNNPNLGGDSDMLIFTHFPLPRDVIDLMRTVAHDCRPSLNLCFWAAKVTTEGKRPRSRRQIETRGSGEVQEEKEDLVDVSEAFEHFPRFRKVVFLVDSMPGFPDKFLLKLIPNYLHESVILLPTPYTVKSGREEKEFAECMEARRGIFTMFFRKEFDSTYEQPDEVDSPDKEFRAMLAQHHSNLSAARRPKTASAKRKAGDASNADQRSVDSFFSKKPRF